MLINSLLSLHHKENNESTTISRIFPSDTPLTKGQLVQMLTNGKADNYPLKEPLDGVINEILTDNYTTTPGQTGFSTIKTSNENYSPYIQCTVCLPEINKIVKCYENTNSSNRTEIMVCSVDSLGNILRKSITVIQTISCNHFYGVALSDTDILIVGDSSSGGIIYLYWITINEDNTITQKYSTTVTGYSSNHIVYLQKIDNNRYILSYIGTTQVLSFVILSLDFLAYTISIGTEINATFKPNTGDERKIATAFISSSKIIFVYQNSTNNYLMGVIIGVSEDNVISISTPYPLYSGSMARPSCVLLSPTVLATNLTNSSSYSVLSTHNILENSFSVISSNNINTDNASECKIQVLDNKHLLYI